jgi:hypothetical protein
MASNWHAGNANSDVQPTRGWLLCKVPPQHFKAGPAGGRLRRPSSVRPPAGAAGGGERKPKRLAQRNGYRPAGLARAQAISSWRFRSGAAALRPRWR